MVIIRLSVFFTSTFHVSFEATLYIRGSFNHNSYRYLQRLSLSKFQLASSSDQLP